MCHLTPSIPRFPSHEHVSLDISEHQRSSAQWVTDIAVPSQVTQVNIETCGVMWTERNSHLSTTTLAKGRQAPLPFFLPPCLGIDNAKLIIRSRHLQSIIMANSPLVIYGQERASQQFNEGLEVSID